MAYTGLYATDGSLNISVVDGLSYTGVYSADGSVNVIVSDGSTYVGAYHPCGAWWVTVSPGTTTPLRAPDGSLYVNTSLAKDGSQSVTVVSGSLTPPGSGFYYPWIFT